MFESEEARFLRGALKMALTTYIENCGVMIWTISALMMFDPLLWRCAKSG